MFRLPVHPGGSAGSGDENGNGEAVTVEFPEIDNCREGMERLVETRYAPMRTASVEIAFYVQG